ncbi:MAG: peptide deformylase, partial [Candidatus Absconditabacterales bacterium]
HMRHPIKHIQTGMNNPILRTISEEIQEIDQELIIFCHKLLTLMYQNKGVGLAAPQVGENIRVIVTSQRDKKKTKDKLLGETIMINPKITERSKETILREEACISLPNCTGMVKRHKAITIEFLDIQGKKQNKKYKEFNAVIIQHEIDHLDGILFMDKIVKKKSAKKG